MYAVKGWAGFVSRCDLRFTGRRCGCVIARKVDVSRQAGQVGCAHLANREAWVKKRDQFANVGLNGESARRCGSCEHVAFFNRALVCHHECRQGNRAGAKLIDTSVAGFALAFLVKFRSAAGQAFAECGIAYGLKQPEVLNVAFFFVAPVFGFQDVDRHRRGRRRGSGFQSGAVGGRHRVQLFKFRKPLFGGLRGCKVIFCGVEGRLFGIAPGATFSLRAQFADLSCGGGGGLLCFEFVLHSVINYC